MIGTGGRARGLMNHLKKLPGNEMVAVCDVYEPRLLQAAEIAGPSAVKVADYRRILDDRDDRRRGDRRARSLAQDHHARRRGRRQGRLRREAGVALDRGRRRDGESHRSVEADRADRHTAAKLGPLRAREADRRFGPPRPDYVRPDLLVSARDRRQLRAGVDGQAGLEALARAREGSAVPAGAFLPVAALLGFRRRMPDRPHDALDRRRPLVHGRRRAALGHRSRAQLQHQAVGSARYRHRDARVPEELHGGVPRHVCQPRGRRRAGVPGRARHAQDRPGTAGCLPRRCARTRRGR